MTGDAGCAQVTRDSERDSRSVRGCSGMDRQASTHLCAGDARGQGHETSGVDQDP